MKLYRLDEMKGGWFVGNFEPSCLRTDAFEVASKQYKSGDHESRHVHRIATEITVITAGRVIMNGQTFVAGDVILLEPGESADFEVLEDALTVVVKTPSIIGDKYPA